MVVTQNCGAKAEAKTSCFSGGLSGNEGIERAIRVEKSSPGVAYENLYVISLGGSFQTNGFALRQGCCRAAIRAFHGFKCELQAMQNGLAHLLRPA